MSYYDRNKPVTELPPGSILLHSITPAEFYEQVRAIIKQEMQQDQLLTKEGALKMTGVSNATFMKAVNEGIIKPQLVKGRTKAMYLESEVLKIEKKRKPL
jgi:hypothetical protein